MPATALAPTRLTADALVPGAGLEPGDGPGAWDAATDHVRFTADADLAPGWYRVRVAVRSLARFTTHKRADLTLEPADGNPRPPARETFTWNCRFDERFMLKLTRPAAGLRLDLFRSEGPFVLEAFDVRPMTPTVTVAHAVREKLRLIRAYKCTGPVLWRGGKMLLTGRFQKFGTKLLKGLTDSRQMRVGTGRADEVDAAWSTRRALTAADAERIAEQCDAMTDPPPIAVLLPVDPERLEHARRAAHFVRRQIYPHWELLIAAAGPSGITHHLETLIGPDARVKVSRVSPLLGLATAVAKAVGSTDCERVLVLPPEIELAEHALFHFAQAFKANPDAPALGAKVHDAWDEAAPESAPESETEAAPGECPVPPVVWLVPTRKLGDAVPRKLTPATIAEWAAKEVAAADRTVLDPVLAYPTDDRPLIDKARVGDKPLPAGRPLYLGTHLVGVSGYDHFCFSVIKGLMSAGSPLKLRPGSGVRADLVPPRLMPGKGGWERGSPELLVCAPWVVREFGPGPMTAVYTMWECDRLAPEWVETLNQCRLVVTPSRWGAECFRASGVTVPVAVAPLGYDPLLFHPGHTPFPEVCTFGTAGALIAGGVRKNTQRVIDVFREAFPRTKDVRLKVKITPSSPSVETYDDPRVEVVRATLPHAELANWYRSLTAYVNASAAEGFGLHLIEAMACGRPLITPHYSGLTEFFDPELGYAVNYQMVAVKNDVYDGRMAEPDDASLIARMREVYADRAKAAKLGERSAARAAVYTWKHGGRALVAALRGHGLMDANRLGD